MLLNIEPSLIPIEETRAYQSILAKGKAESEALLLKRQIARRFGALPEWARERLDAADSVQLEAWAEAIFGAGELEQLLG